MCDEKKLNNIYNRVLKVEKRLTEMESKQAEWERQVNDFLNSEKYKSIKEQIKKLQSWKILEKEEED